MSENLDDLLIGYQIDEFIYFEHEYEEDLIYTSGPIGRAPVNFLVKKWLKKLYFYFNFPTYYCKKQYIGGNYYE